MNKKYSSAHARNFLNYKSTNLSTHLISYHSTDKKKAVLLGSSSVAGSNIHKNSTLADYLNQNQSEYYFYNLGSLEGTLMDSIVFLDQALAKTKIDLVVVGLSPDMFVFNSSSLVPIANIEILKKYLSPDEIKKIENEKQKKLYFDPVIDFVSEENIPFKFILSAKSKMNNFAKNIYGDHFDAHVESDKKQHLNFLKNPKWTSRLKALVELCQSKNIPMVFYLEPNLMADRYFSKDELSLYTNVLNEYFDSNHLKAFNLIHSLADSPEFFIDYQHLTPKGYENLAVNLQMKLSGGQL